jgi:hypothetical protein
VRVSRRQIVKACVATAALQAADIAWPCRSVAAVERDGFRWMNKHQNVEATVWRHYDVWNRSAEGACAGLESWRGGFTTLRGILDDAQARGRRVRAVGRRWSLSPVAVCPDIMINTMPLNYHVVGLPASDTSTSSVDASRLVFAQCGTSVLELSLALESRGLSLPTSGASNGQTICGAIATGTHGSARRVGSMQDYILGFHLLGDDGRHYWVERASKPVVSEAFCQKLGATLRRDDRLFRAAVVSFGSFGIMHAVLFEAVPLYLLEVHRRQMDWPVVRDAAATLDLDPLRLPYPGVEPFHFEVAVNPYSAKPGQRGAVATAMYKQPYREFDRRWTGDVTMVPGVDLLAVSGRLATLLPAAIPTGVNSMLNAMMKANALPALGTHREIFDTTELVGKSLSAEVGVDLSNAGAAIDTLIDVAGDYPFPGLFGLRYVQRSDAFLAFTRFDTTCTIEMTGAGSRRTLGFYDRAWTALDRAKIPYTLHWGKVNNTTCDNIRARWGTDVDNWLSARRSLLTCAGRAMFTNDLLAKCQLHV